MIDLLSVLLGVVLGFSLSMLFTLYFLRWTEENIKWVRIAAAELRESEERDRAP